MKECLRCGQLSEVSVIGASLINFVCDQDRLDTNSFHYGHDTTTRAMEKQSPGNSHWDESGTKYKVHTGNNIWR
jgi:hypothetical protein